MNEVKYPLKYAADVVHAEYPIDYAAAVTRGSWIYKIATWHQNKSGEEKSKSIRP